MFYATSQPSDIRLKRLQNNGKIPWPTIISVAFRIICLKINHELYPGAHIELRKIA